MLNTACEIITNDGFVKGLLRNASQDSNCSSGFYCVFLLCVCLSTCRLNDSLSAILDLKCLIITFL